MKAPFPLDERNVNVIRAVCTIMYLITLLLLISTMFHRQFVLNQATEEFEDIAIIITLNTVCLIAAVLYFGGLTFEKIKPFKLLSLYTGFVALGFSFTLFKYFILLDQPMSVDEILDKFVVVASILALLMVFYMIFAYFGKKKIDKDMA